MAPLNQLAKSTAAGGNQRLAEEMASKVQQEIKAGAAGGGPAADGK
jgi:hypothetical protein